MLYIPENTRNGLLDMIAAMLDGAGAPGRLEFLDAKGVVLGSLALSEPCASPAKNGILKLNEIKPGTAAAEGKIVAGRLVDAAGITILECNVSTYDSDTDAVIRLATVFVVPGLPLSIQSFALSLPPGARP